jgi:hypothetical protein
MKKTTRILLLLLLGTAIVRVALAGTPPLVHKLPSGETLILVPVPEADYVTVQLFIDKRPFKDNLLKQIYISAYIGNLEQSLSKIECVVRLFPLEAIPEFAYDFRSQAYLNFKASSVYFNKNLKQILTLFLGKAHSGRFFLNAREQIIAQARKTYLFHSPDSVEHFFAEIRLKDFKTFVNSVSLRRNVYLYIAGNMDLFKTVKTALQLSPDWQPETKKKALIREKKAKDWYWTFVFWKFSVDALKRTLAGRAHGVPMRLYALLTMNDGAIPVWLQRGNKTVLPKDSIRAELSHRFAVFFEQWYRHHYFYDLKWMYEDTDEQGFLRLLSTAYAGQPDILFSITQKEKTEELRTRYEAFLKRLYFGNPEGK